MLKVISFFEQASKNVGLFLIEPDAMLKDIQALEAFPALLRQARREPYFLPVVYPVQQFVPESLMPFHGRVMNKIVCVSQRYGIYPRFGVSGG